MVVAALRFDAFAPVPVQQDNVQGRKLRDDAEGMSKLQRLVRRLSEVKDGVWTQVPGRRTHLYNWVVNPDYRKCLIPP